MQVSVSGDGPTDRAKLIAVVIAAVVSLLAGASPASAHHSYPAAYSGTVVGSQQQVAFTVSAGEFVSEFHFAAGQACGASMSQGSVKGSDSVTDHALLLGDGQGTYVQGTFTEFRKAEGTLRIQAPFFNCTLSWTATTTAPLPPECNDDHDNDADGRKDFPNDPDCFSRNHHTESDITPPDTVITSGPSEGSTVGAGVTFGFGGMPANDVAGYRCQLDAGPYETCGPQKSYTGLPDGWHTFRVKAVDGSGNEDPSPAIRTFYADRTPPDTAITGGPADGAHISDSSPAFTFEGTPANDVAYYYCYVNDVFKGQCTSGATIADAPLPDGTYTLKVAAVDAQSNQDQSPTQRTFTIDTAAPDTLITSGPTEDATVGDSPVFEFAAAPAGDVDHFLCALSDEAFQPCEPGTPVLGSPLPDGPYRLAVVTVDKAGNRDETPAERNFVVDTTAPDTVITAGPAEGETVKTGSPVFSFVGDPAADTAGFVCSVDDGPSKPCESGGPVVESPLPDGRHSFAVRAVDRVGNIDATAARRSFTVDTTVPNPGTQPPPDQGRPAAEPPESPPAFTATAKRKQRPLKQRGLVVIATCPEASCTLSASGSITLPGKTSQLKLKSASLPGRLGERVRLKLTLSKKATKKLRRAFRRTGSVKRAQAVVLIRAANAHGTATPIELRIKLKK